MREIKTKAYYKHDSGNSVNLGQKFNPIDSFRWREEGQPVTICLFTGLYDENGKEIYEGDIVRVNGVNSLVIYNDDDATFSVTDKPENGPHSYLFQVVGDSEVIGNIHENPELLS